MRQGFNMKFDAMKSSYKPLLLALVLISPASWTSEPAGNARRPPPDPDPRSRAIPDLVCTGERSVTVATDDLATGSEETPLRLRLRGNLLYLGQNSNDERFFGLINRSDRRRWVSGTSTLLLDEALERGVWVRLSLDGTRISAVRCAPSRTTPQ